MSTTLTRELRIEGLGNGLQNRPGAEEPWAVEPNWNRPATAPLDPTAELERHCAKAAQCLLGNFGCRVEADPRLCFESDGASLTYYSGVEDPGTVQAMAKRFSSEGWTVEIAPPAGGEGPYALVFRNAPADFPDLTARNQGAAQFFFAELVMHAREAFRDADIKVVHGSVADGMNCGHMAAALRRAADAAGVNYELAPATVSHDLIFSLHRSDRAFDCALPDAAAAERPLDRVILAAGFTAEPSRDEHERAVCTRALGGDAVDRLLS
jgi:hypothetical protein